MYFGPSISVGRRGVSYGDSDAQAFIAATGLTGTTEVNAVNNLVANLKSYGLWSKMKAIYPFVSDTYNQFSYTEDLTNGAWQKTTTVATPNATTAPDGTNTGWSITGGNIRQILATTGTNAYTCYVKKKTNRYFFCTIYALGIDNVVWGDLDTGLITQTQNSVSNASMTSVGNGWYKLTFNFNVTAVSTEVWLPMCCTASGSFTRGTDIFVWHPQFQLGSTFSDYQTIATTPANRFVSQFKYNLKDARDLDAAFRLAFNGTWTYSKQGATPNGSNAFANTYLNDATNLTLNNLHKSFYSRTSAYIATNSVEIGVTNGTSYSNEISIYHSIIGANKSYISNGGVVASFTDTSGDGYYIGTSTSATSTKLVKNGSIVSTVTTTNTQPLLSFNTYIGANDVNGTAGFYSTRQVAFSTIGNGLTDTEATNLYTSVQLFQQELSRYVGVPIVSDANAQAFLDAAVITDQTQANAVNTLVTDLKTYGLWTKMKAIYPFVGGTATTHKWNLKDPRDLDAAYRLAFSGAWTHSSTGALPNGTNAYANTFFNQQGNWTSTSNGAMGVYLRTNSVGAYCDMGAGTISSGLNSSTIYSRFTGDVVFSGLNCSAVTPSSANTNSQGFHAVSRTNSTSYSRYKRGTSTINLTNTDSIGTNINRNIYLGAGNDAITAASYSNREIAYSFLGDGLTQSEIDLYYTAVQNFQTSLSRQV
jgi:hypothetical protein